MNKKEIVFLKSEQFENKTPLPLHTKMGPFPITPPRALSPAQQTQAWRRSHRHYNLVPTKWCRKYSERPPGAIKPPI